ncbi:NAD(P)/FAD-dependent oxidoreductase [Radiobacillus deserti]|uniref:NAD(P)/FAD-dependent oxidoreductase n=1 Tax=Radiobacillus deserti TaxID=2594883 RepID=A0A516KHU7_9BACI|nr:NAD(P)/FAD-dependent oxidoreductase [Radiobacillus deserti]QDP40968.1 NAD(P)/FAD-dependent oxidoreductase [Radiobacillus deserti]
MNKPKIVILGAGFGGITTAVKLQKKLSRNDAHITLVNKHDYHYQTTWLHENAAGTLHHDRTRIPVKDIVDTNKIDFVQDTVVEIKPDEKKVVLKNGELDYDYLVVGLGFEAATFGIPGIMENAFTINSINSARLIKQHIEYNFAMYNNEKEKRPERLNIIIGGGGFTGIEFAGEIANRVPELCKEYDIDPKDVRMIVLEGAPTILPGFDPQLIEYAMNSLEARGVEFKTGALLKECRVDGITYEKDEKQEDIPALTTIWAAGVRANSLIETSGLEHNRGKVPVQPDLRAPSHPDVFVVGDCALIMNEETGRPYPPTAQIAMQEAETIAHNLSALVHGKENLESFEFINRGSVASLGDSDAIGVIFGDKKIFGWTASFMKKMIDNRALFKIGGLGLVLKKGKFNIF